MTPIQRAEKLVASWDSPGPTKKLIELIAAQIEEAERNAKTLEATHWALSHAEHEKDLETKFFYKGFSAAKEKAKEVAGKEINLCDICYTADRIFTAIERMEL